MAGLLHIKYLLPEWVKKKLRKLVNYRSIFLSRTIARLRHGAPSFGLNGLDRELVARIDTSPNFYVELGANDGVKQSNTLLLELFYGWRGVLIEPIEKSFRKLKKNRSSRRNKLFQRACVSFEYPHSHVEIAYSNLMSSPIGLDADVEDPIHHAISGEVFLEEEDFVRIESVAVETLTDILDNAMVPSELGLLSLDVEGAELEVLRGIDFARFTFKWILVESRKVERISNFLATHGYSLEAQLSLHDYLFIKKAI